GRSRKVSAWAATGRGIREGGPVRVTRLAAPGPPADPAARGTCGMRLPFNSPNVVFALLSAHDVVNATSRKARHSSSSSEPSVLASPLDRCRVIAVGVLVNVLL